MPSYRIVVIEHARSPQAGKYLERLGSYDPKSKQRTLSEERIKYWMSVGAQPSATVHNMLVSAGVLNAKKINVLPSYKAPTPEAVGVPTSPAESVGKMPPEAALAVEAAQENEVKPQSDEVVEPTPEV